jgi:hypothetical protein
MTAYWSITFPFSSFFSWASDAPAATPPGGGRSRLLVRLSQRGTCYLGIRREGRWAGSGQASQASFLHFTPDWETGHNRLTTVARAVDKEHFGTETHSTIDAGISKNQRDQYVITFVFKMLASYS